jgi:hypothetical protein
MNNTPIENNDDMFKYCLPENYEQFIEKTKKYKHTNLSNIKENDNDLVRLRDLHALYHIYCGKTNNPYEKSLYGTNYSWVEANENPAYNDANITDDTHMGKGYDDASTAVGGKSLKNTHKKRNRKRKSMKRRMK